ncbi:alpha/beta fold hydrolase [Streptomyces sp. NPDC006692]|uniref:alpha/beta fold hydrolase n=1 Tax=unclassified Streptomyces TaxID=2593676 RepID=UPI0036C86754
MQGSSSRTSRGRSAAGDITQRATRSWPSAPPATPAAARVHQVITFDHRNPATGPAAEELAGEVRELAAALGLPPTPLVGHSLGALAVQELLATDPAMATRAVLAATRGRPDPVGDALARAEQDRAAMELQLPAAYEAFVRLTQNLSPRTLADEGAAAEWLDLFEFSALSGGGAVHHARTLTRDRLADYAAITTPLLVVGFADDLLAPARLGREVAEAVPGGRYLELPDCGHLGFLERPAAFNRAVLDFLTDTPPGGPRVR